MKIISLKRSSHLKNLTFSLKRKRLNRDKQQISEPGVRKSFKYQKENCADYSELTPNVVIDFDDDIEMSR